MIKSKRFLSLLICVLMTLTLTSCGTNTAVSSTSAADDIIEELPEGETKEVSEDNTSEEISDDSTAEEGVTSAGLRLVMDHTYDLEDGTEDGAYVMYSHMNTSFCHVDKDCADEYPLLAARLDDFAAGKLINAKEMYSRYHEDIAEAQKMREDLMGEWFYEVNPAVIRADDVVTSILECYCSYAGGAHPVSAYCAEVYDSKTGELLELADVVNDMDKVQELLADALKTNYPDTDFWGVDESLDRYFKGEVAPLNWTADYEGVTFYFSPYDIAPYAAGLISAQIPFEGNESLFAESIMNVSDAYAVAVDRSIPVFMDIDGDKIPEKIEPEFYESDNAGGQLLCFIDEDQIGSEEIYSFKTDFNIIKTSDGKIYLYANCLGDSDYTSIRVYDITNGDFRFVEEVGYSPAGYYDDTTNTRYSGVINNPMQMHLAKRTDALYTGSGVSLFHIGENGIPVNYKDYYELTNGLELTVKKDIETTQIDNDTFEEIGKFTLKEGEKITLIRTDDLSFVDASLSDGTCVRLSVVLDTWPQEVEGKVAEDYFDGIFYAG